MSNKWSEMSNKEKVLQVLTAIATVVLAFFAIADFTNWLPFAEGVWLIAAAVTLVLDGIRNWNEKRKLAWVELVGSVVTLAIGILTLAFL